MILGKETEKEPTVTVVPDDLREIRAYVTLPPDALDRVSGEKVPFSFVATDTNDGTATHRGTNFRKPAQ